MMKIEKGKFIRVIIITVCMTVAVVGILFSVFCKVTGRSLIKGEDYTFVKKIMSKYGKLYAIQEKMNKDGYFKVSESRQMDAIYKGLVKSLKDPYSEYFTAGEAKEWNSRLNGTFFGIGVIFAQDKKGDFIIGEVIEKSPAAGAGLKKNDIIEKVDGKKYKNAEALKKAITGKAGSKVRVTYRRGGKSADVSIVRGKVTEFTVKGTVTKEKIGYIRISSFAEKTAEEFKTELAALEKKNVKGVVIDIRANGGGYANQGVKIADMLLPECTIMYVKDSKGKKTYFNSNEDATKLKYVLLVDGNTASTSEILTAAVKDNKGGAIVGSKTFGKGVMQVEYPFKDGSALKLTTNQYFSPKGQRINKKGITPDYNVPLKPEYKVDRQLEKAVELLKSAK